MKRILYYIYFFPIAIPLLLVTTVFAALTTIIGSMLGFSRNMGYWPGHIWARLFCAISLVRVKVYGSQNISKGQSYVFVANHQGAYDIFAIYGFLGHNFRWMMKKSLEKIPLVGYSCRVSGHIYVDNSSRAAVKTTMSDAEQRLAGGMSVVVFPEGSRTLDGRMHAFRRGAYTLAVEFGLPVVPVTIDGAYDVLRRDSLLPHPGLIKLTIHPAIKAPEGGRHELAELMKESAEAIASALPLENRPVSE
ncbi:MAG: 1-acyl-sn-glycerol-3-phosphate acyltransferase [Muribaculaceae bacterium]|nr:1-acyl-sn-glycerol-3-phosphate acyltransferase [Muribaculaceae bacterium]